MASTLLVVMFPKDMEATDLSLDWNYRFFNWILGVLDSGYWMFWILGTGFLILEQDIG